MIQCWVNFCVQRCWYSQLCSDPADTVYSVPQPPTRALGQDMCNSFVILVWFGLVWCGLVWFGLVLFCFWRAARALNHLSSLSFYLNQFFILHLSRITWQLLYVESTSYLQSYLFMFYTYKQSFTSLCSGFFCFVLFCFALLFCFVVFLLLLLLLLYFQACISDYSVYQHPIQPGYFVSYSM